VISTNAMLIGLYDNLAGFNTGAAMGQPITADDGWRLDVHRPQGIVHGTYITLLNAGRLYLNVPRIKTWPGLFT